MSKHKPPPVVFVALSWDLGVPSAVTTKRSSDYPDSHRYVLAEIGAKPYASDETVEAVISALAGSMGYLRTEGIVSDYLAGKSVLTQIGSHGVWHFNHMMRTLGREPPRAEGNL
jgi:hypothetical protein